MLPPMLLRATPRAPAGAAPAEAPAVAPVVAPVAAPVVAPVAVLGGLAPVAEVQPAPPAPAPPVLAPPVATPPVEAALPPPAVSVELPPPPVVVEPLAVMEKRLILAALAETAQDVSRAAALLQINPSTVYRKLQQWKAAGELL
jgi:two-component system repressor protein LuxO